MELTTRQAEYLEHELFQRGRSFIDDYYAEKNRIYPSTPDERGLSTDQIEAARLADLQRT